MPQIYDSPIGPSSYSSLAGAPAKAGGGLFGSPLGLGAALGGVGILKSVLFDAPREHRQRIAQSEATRWSPWTGMSGQAPTTNADPLGSGLQFGTTGAMLGQGVQNQGNQDAFNSRLLGVLERQGR